MGSGYSWIAHRYANYKEKRDVDEQKKIWQQNARSSYDAKLQRLMDQIASDVEQYNQLFSDWHECKATLDKTAKGVAVRRGECSVTVTAKDGSVIGIAWRESVDPVQKPKADSLEVAADDKGEIKYKHSADFLDVAHASELILGPVLCGQ